jgi:hypothetical protein
MAKNKTTKPKLVKIDALVKPGYKVILFLNNTMITYRAKTLEEAIANIHPPFYKTKGLLRVEYNGLSTEKLLTIPQMKRFFSNEVAKIVLAKNIKLVLK